MTCMRPPKIIANGILTKPGDSNLAFASNLTHSARLPR